MVTIPLELFVAIMIFGGLSFFCLVITSAAALIERQRRDGDKR